MNLVQELPVMWSLVLPMLITRGRGTEPRCADKRDEGESLESEMRMELTDRPLATAPWPSAPPTTAQPDGGAKSTFTI
ncbi:hypothetical protein TrVGV298_006552 [Trichoderma virens]|nr:hypothetical protein TrVGV298_006552 [Trichoderma virens]